MTSYTIQAGDTLGAVARRFYGNASLFPLIVAANRIDDPDRLSVGTVIVIPDSPGPRPATNGGGALALLSARTVELNEQRLSKVHPALVTRGRTLVELCAASGVAVLITQGLRSVEEQDQLYAVGRTRPPIGSKFIVTKARGGQSWHNFGLAFDIVILDAIGKANWDTRHPSWLKAAEVGKSLGLGWGGDWKGFKDLPHFQYTGALTLAECRTLYAGGLQAVWDRVA